jgi:CRP-like cAMP-binding protein
MCRILPPPHFNGEQVRRRDFEQQLGDLLRAQVIGLDAEGKVALLRRQGEAYRANHAIGEFTAAIEPFVPGRRPDDEIAHPGLGSSEEVALFNPGRVPPDTLVLLVRGYRRGRATAELPAQVHLLGTIEALDQEGQPLGTVADWRRRNLSPDLRSLRTADAPSTVAPAHALRLDVEKTFAAEAVPIDPAHYLGFASLFHQRFRLLLDVEVSGAHVCSSSHDFEIHNEQLYGSLYQRLVDRLLPWDMSRQTGSASPQASVQSHPWYPVLGIGMQKARLYMQAITDDLVEQKRLLTNPGWLLRVGLFLELLTCLGVAEAVKDEIDLLEPAERDRFENAPVFREIRRRLDVAAWKEVWALRQSAFSQGESGTTAYASNLMRKKAATLAFLHTHHADLKHAIELAGPNLQNAQESWHRVFRDAERAVLQMNEEAFPELAQFPQRVRHLALWHQAGTLGGLRLIPSQLTKIFGDQDGIFPSACRQYRASMNEIAAWARDEGLMEYTGDPCVPPSVSLLEAFLEKQTGRLAGLQRRDGFSGTLDVVSEEASRPLLDHPTLVALLEQVDVFSVLSVDELHALARAARPIHLGHFERILVQGQPGSSLFILYEGELEVIARDREDMERQVASLKPPAVVGEMAFLLGEPRGSTVRAVNETTVVEVGAASLRPLVEQRPALLEQLTALLDERQHDRQGASRSPTPLTTLRRAIFGSS